MHTVIILENEMICDIFLLKISIHHCRAIVWQSFIQRIFSIAVAKLICMRGLQTIALQ